MGEAMKLLCENERNKMTASGTYFTPLADFHPQDYVPTDS
jgi:hypothetical protein